jgi:hypothetical protein
MIALVAAGLYGIASLAVMLGVGRAIYLRDRRG